MSCKAVCAWHSGRLSPTTYLRLSPLPLFVGCYCSVNFHTMPGHQTADEQAEGIALQNACQTLFATMGIKNGSLWQLANILVPWARPVTSWLAQHFPDRRLLAVRQVRDGAGVGDWLTAPDALDTHLEPPLPALKFYIGISQLCKHWQSCDRTPHMATL